MKCIEDFNQRKALSRQPELTAEEWLAAASEHANRIRQISANLGLTFTHFWGRNSNLPRPLKWTEVGDVLPLMKGDPDPERQVHQRWPEGAFEKLLAAPIIKPRKE